MGVLRCDRKNCQNIMCDRVSYKYGYICDDCFEELVNSNKDIKEFMDLEKSPHADGERRRNMLEDEFVDREI